MIGSRKRWLLCAVVVLGVAGLVLAGCGSSAKGNATATTSGSSAATGSPINLQVDVELTGSSTVNPQIVAGAKIAAAAINKAGGVNGHKLNIIGCDDQGNPNVAAQCGQSAVSNNVVALVGSSSQQEATIMPITFAAGIPNIGCACSSPVSLTSPLSFPLGGGSLTGTYGPAAILSKAGCTDNKVAVDYIDIAQISGLLNGEVYPAFAATGMKVVNKVPIPPTATDYSSYAAASTANGVQCVLSINGDAADLLTIKAIKAEDPSAIISIPGFSTSQKDITSLGSAASGLILGWGQAIPGFVPGNAGVAQFNKEADAYGDNTNPRVESMVNAWNAVHITADLMTKNHAYTASALLAVLKTTGTPSNIYAAVPFNWQQQSKLSSTVRSFSNDAFFATVNSSGQIVPAYNGQAVDLTNLSSQPNLTTP